MRNAMLLTAVFIGTLMSAGSARATVLSKFQFKGNQLNTSFFGSTAITCGGGGSGTLSVEGGLAASESVAKVKGLPREVSNSLIVNVAISNTCTGVTQLGSAFIVGGFTPPNHTLSSASVVGSTPLEDAEGNDLGITFSINATVTGQGPVTSFRSSDQSQTFDTFSGAIIASHSRNSNATRSGTASGTIAINGVTLAPTFVDTVLSRGGTGQVVLEK